MFIKPYTFLLEKRVPFSMSVFSFRNIVSSNLENLEISGNFVNLEISGKSQGILQVLWKNEKVV